MIKNFEFTSIDVRRFARSTEVFKNINIQVNHDISKVIERSDIETEFQFVFAINYTGIGAIASVKFEGFVLYEGQGGIAQRWVKEKKLPDEVSREVQNVFVQNCLMEGILVSRSMKLPPPIQIHVSAGKPAGPKPSSGIEVA